MAAFAGCLPPLASSHHLRHVRKAAEELDRCLVPGYRASLAVDEVICNFSILLEDIEDPLVHFSLTETFISSLDVIKETYSSQWTPELDVRLQFAKLNLYAMAVFLPLQEASEEHFQKDFNRQKLLLSGMQSASSLIKRMEHLSLQPTVEGKYNAGRLTFHPMYFFTNLFFAAVFLFRVFVGNRLIIYAHGTLIIQSINAAHKIFQLAPYNRDMARATRLIERFLSKIGPETAWPDSFSFSELVITNRLGASLLWDTIFRLRLRARDDIDPETGDRNSKRSRLPLAPEMETQSPDPQAEAPTVPLPEDQDLANLFFWDATTDSVLDADQDIFSAI